MPGLQEGAQVAAAPNAPSSRLYIGTSGWSYPKGEGAWDGIFYPPKLADKDKLTFYAQYFNTVEINSSFYRPPSQFAARAWATRVPDDFRFTAKLWQKFTHPKMFEAATGQPGQVEDADFGVFAEGIAPLAQAGKLGEPQGLQDAPQTGFIQNDHMIQALSSYRPDQALDVGILPRALRSSKHFGNAKRPQSTTDLISINAIPIAD